ncbi:hypothetical protein BVIET440_10255 [Burkholderia vietnamiensis]
MATLDQIIQQLRAAGHPDLPAGHPVADGKHHRYGPRKKYWYQLREIISKGAVIGYGGTFGHFSGDDPGTERFEWSGAPMSEEVLAETRRRHEAADREQAERDARQAKLAANRARDQWNRAAEHGESTYLERKRITAEGVRFDADGTIFVPMYQYGDDARLVGLQKITPDGAKRFNKGMEKKGASYLLGEVGADDQIVLVAEGYATARSIRMAIDDAFAVDVCFDAGGILPAVRYLRATYPNVHVLVCADDDWKIEQRMRDWLADEFAFRGELVFGADPMRIEAKNTWYMVAVSRRRDDNGVPYVEVSYGNDVMPLRRKRFENTGLKRAYEAAATVADVSVAYPAFAKRGERKLTLGNVHMILANHKAWQGVIEQDDFGGRVMKRKAPPFRQGVKGEWTDMDDQRCALWLSQRYGLSVRTDIVMNAVLLVADEKHFHDVREYLEGLKWDGVSRVRSMPSTYLGERSVCRVRRASVFYIETAERRPENEKFEYGWQLNRALGV